jgi:hypothetical protein
MIRIDVNACILLTATEAKGAPIVKQTSTGSTDDLRGD